MTKKKKLFWILGLAYVIDRIFYPEKYKKKEAELTMELKYTPGPEYEPIKFDVPKEILCPYCNYRLEEFPKRSKKCPQCKEYIYRTKDYENKIYRLMTVKEYEKKQRALADEQWADLNEQVAELSKSRDWDGLSYTYFQMALQLWNEEKDFFNILQESARWKLRHFQDAGISRVRILDSGSDSCPSCRKQKEKVYSIEEALSTMPLPCKDCTFQLHGINSKVGWCRCCYVAEI